MFGRELLSSLLSCCCCPCVSSSCQEDEHHGILAEALTLRPSSDVHRRNIIRMAALKIKRVESRTLQLILERDDAFTLALVIDKLPNAAELDRALSFAIATRGSAAACTRALLAAGALPSGRDLETAVSVSSETGDADCIGISTCELLLPFFTVGDIARVLISHVNRIFPQLQHQRRQPLSALVSGHRVSLLLFKYLFCRTRVDRRSSDDDTDDDDRLVVRALRSALFAAAATGSTSVTMEMAQEVKRRRRWRGGGCIRISKDLLRCARLEVAESLLLKSDLVAHGVAFSFLKAAICEQDVSRIDIVVRTRPGIVTCDLLMFAIATLPREQILRSLLLNAPATTAVYTAPSATSCTLEIIHAFVAFEMRRRVSPTTNSSRRWPHVARFVVEELMRNLERSSPEESARDAKALTNLIHTRVPDILMCGDVKLVALARVLVPGRTTKLASAIISHARIARRAFAAGANVFALCFGIFGDMRFEHITDVVYRLRNCFEGKEEREAGIGVVRDDGGECVEYGSAHADAILRRPLGALDADGILARLSRRLPAAVVFRVSEAWLGGAVIILSHDGEVSSSTSPSASAFFISSQSSSRPADPSGEGNEEEVDDRLDSPGSFDFVHV